ncbi:MAG TPA: hypothetical protein ACFYED_06570, partial [Candidatus Tripitaka californicus]|uniref:hypothetical protein n=1 Tax=Candidatus Tripitaka californicus TaxID=3367616 RepID=UPI004027929E
PALGLALVTDHELFGWRRSETLTSRKMARRGSTALAGLSELTDTVMTASLGLWRLSHCEGTPIIIVALLYSLPKYLSRKKIVLACITI